MRRVLPRGRRNPSRAAKLRLEGLESRSLLSADVVSSAGIVSPIAIMRTLTAAQQAMIPKGYTLAISPQIGPQLSGGYTPAQVRHAYGVDQLPENGAGQTIAIVDAHDNPTIAADLIAFDQQFGLPAANFVKAIPQGQPSFDAGWAGEIALDVEWSHVIAPMAKILLVEATDATGASLDDAVQYAYSQGASQISMSYGGGESSDELSEDSIYNHPGTTFFASAGDTGAEVLSPSISPYVTAVGGTSLFLDSSGNKQSETSWSDSGGGPSLYEPLPAFQKGFYSSTVRGTPDVAYNADPDTGVYVDDGGQFIVVGGTSAGSPQWAGLAALANQGRAQAGEPPLGTGQTFGTNTVLYTLAGTTSYVNANNDFSDITTGSNGHSATTGYDNVTGLGSPIAQNLIPDLINSFNAKLPTIVAPASATPTPVMAKTTQLSVLAADAAGESTLNYTWSVTSSPTGVTAPTFATNGTNASKRDTATFYSAGTYTFLVRATDKSGLSVTSSVNVQVNSVPTSVTIAPKVIQLSANQSEQFTAPGLDQFGNQIPPTSAALTWTLLSGGGTLTSSGLYKAPATGTIATVQVASGSFKSTASVYVLSLPWLQTDVGTPSVAGDAADNGTGTFTVLGAGTGIAGAADQFQYAYLPLTGNSTLQAQVTAIPYTSASAEAGVSFRSDTTAGSANVTVAITPFGGLAFSYRSVAGGGTVVTTTPGVIPGDYVKLVRAGNLFTAYYSANGTTWTQAGQTNVTMASGVDGGLAVTSSNASTRNTSTFAHVIGDSSTSVVVSASANPNPVTTTSTTLSVLGGDNAGESSLTYTWSTALAPAGAIAPTFATNGTNASKNDVVTFSKAGTYQFLVTIANALGYSTTSSVTVSVVATQTTVGLTPLVIGVYEGGTVQFTAAIYDQFGNKFPKQPLFTYSIVAGGAGGKVSSTGLYTAPTNRTGVDYVNVTGAGTAAVAKVTVSAMTSLAITKTGSPTAGVSQVSVGWGSASAPLVTAADGLRLLPAGRKTDLPWANIQTLAVTLGQAGPLAASDVKVTGLTVANYGPVTVTPVSGTTYLITLARPITSADRVTLTIAAPTIATFTRRLDVLPGDVDDSGAVDLGDSTLATGYLMSTQISADLFGNGVVSTKSVKAIQLLNGTRLPLLS